MATGTRRTCCSCARVTNLHMCSAFNLVFFLLNILPWNNCYRTSPPVKVGPGAAPAEPGHLCQAANSKLQRQLMNVLLFNVYNFNTCCGAEKVKVISLLTKDVENILSESCGVELTGQYLVHIADTPRSGGYDWTGQPRNRARAPTSSFKWKGKLAF